MEHGPAINPKCFPPIREFPIFIVFVLERILSSVLIQQPIVITTKLRITKGLNIIFSEDLSHFDAEAFLKSGAFIRRPDQTWFFAWGKSQTHPQPVEEAPCFFMADFYFSNKNKWLEFESGLWVKNEKNLNRIMELFFRKKTIPLKMNSNCKDSYTNQFASLEEAFQKEELKKAVPVSFASAEVSDMEAHKINWLRKCFAAPLNSTPYGFWNLETGFIGSTPEIFISVDFNKSRFQLKTMALAGTASETMRPGDLLMSEKDIVEHQYVVDEIKTMLSPYGHLEVSQPFEEKFGELTHLRTKIELDGSSDNCQGELLNEFIYLLHPTPALGGYPQSSAKQWLEKNKIVHRGAFGAPFGLNFQNKFYSVVCIRNIIWQKNRLYIFSGGGVVEQSQLESEWEEVLLKKKSIMNFFGI